MYLTIPAMYEAGQITLLEALPNIQRARVIVTVLEELPPAPSEKNGELKSVSWLGSMSHTLVGEIGDIVSPLEETWEESPTRSFTSRPH